MKFLPLAKILGLSVLGFYSLVVKIYDANAQNAGVSGAKSYFCGTNNGMPTTMALRPDGRPKPLIRWVSSLGGLSPKERCERVSQRFKDLMINKGMRIFTPGTYQGSYVVCAVEKVGDPCIPEFNLFTVRSETEAKQITKALKTIGPYVRGPIEQADPSYVYFDLKDYLDDDKQGFEKPLFEAR